MLTFRSLLLPLLIFPLLGVGGTGCQKQADKDHYARALAIERTLLRRNREADYGHPGYVHVLRELRKVPGGSPRKEHAEDMTQRIADGRRFAANKAFPQLQGKLPTRLQGKQAPAPPRSVARNPSSPTAVKPTTAGAGGSLKRAAATERGELTQAQQDALDITLLSTTWCGYCRKARAYMNKKGYPFRELDVEKNPAGARLFQQLTGGRGGVPVIQVNGRVLRGFDRNGLEREVSRVLSP